MPLEKLGPWEPLAALAARPLTAIRLPIVQSGFVFHRSCETARENRELTLLSVLTREALLFAPLAASTSG